MTSRISGDKRERRYSTQSRRTHCRIPPPTRVQVTLDPNLFYTLRPLVPLVLSTPFAWPSGDQGQFRATSDPRYGPIRDPCHGIDGLRPDSRYVLTLSKRSRILWHRIRWWQYGIKDNILAAADLDPRRVKYSPGPHDPIEIDTSHISPIWFSCLS